MRTLAHRVGWLRRAKDSRNPWLPASVEVRTSTASYVLRSSLVGPKVLGLDFCIVISVERLTPKLPSKHALIEQYELTPRQSEVALLLAKGLSNEEIAHRLDISPHTVRHHAEWVFVKLDIHTRKALALKLLG